MELIQINKKAQLNVVVGDEIHPILCDIKGVTLDTVMLFCPLDQREKLQALQENMKVDLNVYSYSGIIVLTSRIKKIQSDSVIIDYPEEKERVQRREYFRVSIQRPLDVMYNDGHKDRMCKGKTIDISGGGVRFWTQEHCQIGFIAEVKMYLKDFCDSDEPIIAKGRIIYAKSHDSRFTSKGGHISVVKFHEISPKSRQLIMKTCFKVQIEMRKKGIL